MIPFSALSPTNPVPYGDKKTIGFPDDKMTPFIKKTFWHKILCHAI